LPVVRLFSATILTLVVLPALCTMIERNTANRGPQNAAPESAVSV
jgi:hypothetical protein